MSSKRATPHSSQLKSDDINISDIWKFLIRRGLIISISVAIGLVCGLVAYLTSPSFYTATAIVEMNKDATSGIGIQDLSGAGSLMGVGSDFMTDMLTQQTVLESDSTALSVIDKLNLMSTPAYMKLRQVNGVPADPSAKYPPLDQDSATRDRALSLFRSGLKVIPVKNTRLLRVAYTDQDPKRAAECANAVVEAYLTNHTKTRYDATAKASTWLTDQLDDLKHHSEDIHKQVSDLENTSGIFTTSMPAKSDKDGGSADPINSSPEYQRLTSMSMELSRAEIARIEKEAIYRLAQSNDPEVILGLGGTKLATEAGGVLESGGQSMQALQSLHSHEAELKIQLASQRIKYGPNNPIILQLQNQIDSVHQQLTEELARLNAQTKADYLLAKANEDAIRKSFDQGQRQFVALGNNISVLSFLREEEGSSRKLYQDLYTRLEEANIAAGVRSSGMAVDDPARTPSRRSAPVKTNFLIAGLAAGFIGGLLIALLLQVRDTSLNIPADFEEYSPYPMLGVIPGFDSAGQNPGYGYGAGKTMNTVVVDDQAWILRFPKSPIAEAYRQIRTSILLSSIDNPPRVILVTSALSGDGKTTTAYNLAVAFAAQAGRVLLMESDMRRPTISKISHCTATKGLSDVLSGRIPLEEALQQHPHMPSLRVMTAGTIPPDPSELLGSKRFSELIDELRKSFDYIIVDAPPAILVTDPVVAASAVDAVVAVVRASKTRKPDLKQMWSALNRPTARILGFIVNDFHRGLQSYGYGYEGSINQSYYYGTDEA
jgi:polysaccharide biosynthesis transport protein